FTHQSPVDFGGEQRDRADARRREPPQGLTDRLSGAQRIALGLHDEVESCKIRPLQRMHVDDRAVLLPQRLVLRRGYNAYDFEQAAAADIYALTERTAAFEGAPGERLVDDRYRRRARNVLRSEVAAGEQRGSRRCEVRVGHPVHEHQGIAIAGLTFD